MVSTYPTYLSDGDDGSRGHIGCLREILTTIGDTVATTMRVHTTVGHKTGSKFAEISPCVSEVATDKDHGLTAVAGPVVRARTKYLDGIVYP